MHVVISPLCQEKDQTTYERPLGELIPEILEALAAGKAKPGYRSGVLLVPLKPTGFQGRIVTLQEGDIVMGRYERRQENETPRKQFHLLGRIQPDPIVAVDAVLYSRETLAEGKENSDLTADYEVIALLPKISEEEQPMPPETLMANHFHQEGDGGTNTQMTPQEFEAALRKSYEFWRNKATLK